MDPYNVFLDITTITTNNDSFFGPGLHNQFTAIVVFVKLHC